MKWLSYYSSTDAKYHFFATFVMMIVLSSLFGIYWGSIETIMIGICKEIFDMRKKNPTGFSLLDLSADCAGLISGGVVFSLFR